MQIVLDPEGSGGAVSNQSDRIINDRALDRTSM